MDQNVLLGAAVAIIVLLALIVYVAPLFRRAAPPRCVAECLDHPDITKVVRKEVDVVPDTREIKLGHGFKFITGDVDLPPHVDLPDWDEHVPLEIFEKFEKRMKPSAYSDCPVIFLLKVNGQETQSHFDVTRSVAFSSDAAAQVDAVGARARMSGSRDAAGSSSSVKQGLRVECSLMLKRKSVDRSFPGVAVEFFNQPGNEFDAMVHGNTFVHTITYGAAMVLEFSLKESAKARQDQTQREASAGAIAGDGQNKASLEQQAAMKQTVDQSGKWQINTAECRATMLPGVSTFEELFRSEVSATEIGAKLSKWAGEVLSHVEKDPGQLSALRLQLRPWPNQEIHLLSDAGVCAAKQLLNAVFHNSKQYPTQATLDQCTKELQNIRQGVLGSTKAKSILDWTGVVKPLAKTCSKINAGEPFPDQGRTVEPIVFNWWPIVTSNYLYNVTGEPIRLEIREWGNKRRLKTVDIEANRKVRLVVESWIWYDVYFISKNAKPQHVMFGYLGKAFDIQKLDTNADGVDRVLMVVSKRSE